MKPVIWEEFLLERLRQRGLSDSRTASDDDEFSLHDDELTPRRSGAERRLLNEMLGGIRYRYRPDAIEQELERQDRYNFQVSSLSSS